MDCHYPTKRVHLVSLNEPSDKTLKTKNIYNDVSQSQPFEVHFANKSTQALLYANLK